MNMKFPDAGLKYVTLDGYAYMGALWWMNNAKYQSMPKELKKVITDGFYNLQQLHLHLQKENQLKLMKILLLVVEIYMFQLLIKKQDLKKCFTSL